VRVKGITLATAPLAEWGASAGGAGAETAAGELLMAANLVAGGDAALYPGSVFAQRDEVVFFLGHPSRLAHPFLYIRALVVALVGGIVAGLASAIADGRVQSGWVVVGVLGVFGLYALRGELRRVRVRYAITDRRLRIETGLLARRKRQAELEWVQNVTMHQSMTDRFLGIGTVVFITGEEAEHEFRFRGVADPRRLLSAVDRELPGRISEPRSRGRGRGRGRGRASGAPPRVRI
jgi:membrane protein YdbS with pleckstrin-like domain